MYTPVGLGEGSGIEEGLLTVMKSSVFRRWVGVIRSWDEKGKK